MNTNPKRTWHLAAAMVVLSVGNGLAQNQQANDQQANDQQAKGQQAQDRPRTATLAQAVVAEIYEHDLGKAMDLYRAVAADAGHPAETRTQAHLRLAKAYRRLGQVAEAEASLRRAARGSGAAAKEAAAILAGEVQDDGDLVKAKVQQALLAMRLTGKPDHADLVWIGRAAVPYIIKAVDAEKADLRFLSNASAVLLQLGGPEVLKWIDATRSSADVLRKRAVIKGFRDGDQDVRRRLAGFLADRDASVRLEVLSRGAHIVSAAETIAALQDADAAVRREAMHVLRASWGRLDHGSSKDKYDHFVQMLPLLARETVSFGSNTAFPSIGNWLAGHGRLVVGPGGVQPAPQEAFPATDAARRTILRALTMPCFRDTSFAWPPVRDGATPDAFAAELVASAKAIGPVVQDRGRREPRKLGCMATVSKIVDDLLPHWDGTALPAVLELVKLGYDQEGRLAGWVVGHATAEQLSAVVDRLQDFDDRRGGVGKVCAWLNGIGVPDSVLPQLIAVIERIDSPRRQSAQFDAVLQAILAIDSPDSVAFLVQKIRSGDERFLRCIGRTPNASDEKAVLQRLLVLPGDGEMVAKVRRFAFDTLLGLHAEPGDAALFARAYELGMGDSGPCHNPATSVAVTSTNRRGVFLAYGPQGAMTILANEAARVAILEACLATGRPAAFKDLAWALHWRTTAKVAAVVARYITQCPLLKDNRGLDVRPELVRRVMTSVVRGAAGAGLAVAALRHESVAVRQVAMSALQSAYASDKAVVAAVMQRLTDPDVQVRRRAASFLVDSDAENPALVAAVTERLRDSDPTITVHAIRFLQRRQPDSLLTASARLLGHADPAVRHAIGGALVAAHGAKVIDRVGPLLVDEGIPQSLRVRLAKQLGGLMDLAVVPHLLAALKSPALQAEAQQQLTAIRFYHEESRKWNRVMQGAGLDDASAAEALVRQARAGRKDLRLAAIESLGTLAEPATLPFLVQLMGDADPEIASAAKQAVGRINAAARDRK